jgi:hypothetical protein
MHPRDDVVSNGRKEQTLENDQQVQLSLDVGGGVGAYVLSEFTLGGKVASFSKELEREENVIVTVVNADGEVILTAEGWVRGVEIETVPETNTAPRFTKRKHKIKLGESAP